MKPDKLNYIKDVTKEGLTYWRDLILPALLGVGVTEGAMTVWRMFDVQNYQPSTISNPYLEVLSKIPENFAKANADVTATGAILMITVAGIIGIATYGQIEKNRKKPAYKV